MSRETLDAKTQLGRNALHIAALHNKKEIFKFLIRQGFSITAVTNQGETVEDLARKYECQEVLDYIKELNYK